MADIQPVHPIAPRTNPYAVVSLVFGILWIVGGGSLVAVFAGHTALRQVRTSGEAGNGLAVAGLVLGYVGLATTAVLFLPGVVVLVLALLAPVWFIVWDQINRRARARQRAEEVPETLPQ